MVCRTLSGCANLNTPLSKFKASLINMYFEKAPEVISVLMPPEFEKQFLEVFYSFQDIVKN